MSGLPLKQHTARLGGVTYSFNGLVELMAKATPSRIPRSSGSIRVDACIASSTL